MQRRQQSEYLSGLRPAFWASVLACCLGASFPHARAGELPAPDARSVLDKAYTRPTGDRVRGRWTLTVSDGAETTVRTASVLRMETSEGKRSLVRFDSPSDVRGTAFLNYDYEDGARSDEQWIFLVSLGRTTRIAKSAMAGSFMGSDFSYADLSKPDPKLYELTMVKESTLVDGDDCWVIDAVPREARTREETGYAKTRLWISKDKFIPLQMQAWLSEDRKVKYVKTLKLAKIDGIWTPLQIQARTVRDGRVLSETLLETSEVAYQNVEINLQDFTPERLKAL
ncbi:MAG: outer membrane lipoprotein-sorting protein [Myxococcales bacterium]